MSKEKEINQHLEKGESNYSIKPLLSEEVDELYNSLEKINWAPWLAASCKTIEGRTHTFTKGQLVMKDKSGLMLACLSLNQINWDGNPKTLPSWDNVAGNPTDYSNTYIQNGNTLVLMSMNVNPNYKGLHLPTKMINETQKLANELSVKYLIGSFRPSGYGLAKIHSKSQPDFWSYCQQTRKGTNKPVDPWLGSLWHNGMQLIKPDNKAMFVSVGFSEFMGYKSSYNPELWVSKDYLKWECGEVGTWYTDPDQKTAYYIESNVWGSLPLK